MTLDAMKVDDDHKNNPGKRGDEAMMLVTVVSDLLIVAFDIVLASCIAPLFAAIYFKNRVSIIHSKGSVEQNNT